MTDRKAPVTQPLWGPKPHPLAPHSSSYKGLQQGTCRPSLSSQAGAGFSGSWQFCSRCGHSPVAATALRRGCARPLGVELGCCYTPSTRDSLAQQGIIWPRASAVLRRRSPSSEQLRPQLATAQGTGRRAQDVPDAEVRELRGTDADRASRMRRGAGRPRPSVQNSWRKRKKWLDQEGEGGRSAGT